MKKITNWISVVACAAALSTPLQAQDISLLPEGQTLISLSVTQRVDVEQDLLIATLRVEGENQKADALQSMINEKMALALQAAGEYALVEISTGRYSVYQTNDTSQSGRTNKYWRGSQSITLESKNAADLLILAGELQEQGLLMSQLMYSLSAEKSDETRDSLMESAIVKARASAERAAAALGKTQVDVASIDESFSYQRPIMERAMAMDASSVRAAPVAETSETEVSLTVRIQAVAK